MDCFIIGRYVYGKNMFTEVLYFLYNIYSYMKRRMFTPIKYLTIIICQKTFL